MSTTTSQWSSQATGQPYSSRDPGLIAVSSRRLLAASPEVRRQTFAPSTSESTSSAAGRIDVSATVSQAVADAFESTKALPNGELLGRLNDIPGGRFNPFPDASTGPLSHQRKMRPCLMSGSVAEDIHAVGAIAVPQAAAHPEWWSCRRSLSPSTTSCVGVAPCLPEIGDRDKHPVPTQPPGVSARPRLPTRSSPASGRILPIERGQPSVEVLAQVAKRLCDPVDA